MKSVQDCPRVIVIDDDAAMRDSLSWLFKAEEIVCELYSSGEAFIEAYPQFEFHCPVCVLLDVRMQGLDGLGVLQRIQTSGRHIPVIIMTGYADVSMAVSAMKAGAVEFLEKPLNNDLLLQRVRSYLEQSRKWFADDEQSIQIREKLAHLTERERQVLDKLVEGKPNKVVAAELGISTRTVEIHRANIMHKLEAHSFSDIVKMALQSES